VTTTAHVPNPSRKLRLPSQAAWLGARASNVRRKGGRLVIAALLGFTCILGLYEFLPPAIVEMQVLLPRESEPTADTTALIVARTRAEAGLLAADSALERQRSALQLSEQNALRVLDSLSSMVPITYGDSLMLLERLISRAEASPLRANYVALGHAPFMRDDLRARALVDSVVLISARRDSLQNRASGDSTFVFLTNQLNELGRSLRAVAQVRERALRSLNPGAASAQNPEGPRVDTLVAMRARDAARSVLTRADDALRSGRQRAHARDTLQANRTTATETATLPLLLLAAALLSSALAFVVVLALEMRKPKVADAVEAERETGVRVIAHVSQKRQLPNRRRRATDLDLSPVLRPASDDYRILCGNIVAQWPRDGIVTVTGDRAVVNAAIAANIGAVLATEAHSTLLVDEDFPGEPVRRVLHVRRVAGLAAALENRRRWAESLVTVPVGRGRVLEVLPSGARDKPLGPAELQALVGEVNKAARRYDATVVVAPPAYAVRARAGDDVVVCVLRGATPLRDLVQLVTALIDGGAKVRGLVVWDGPLPKFQGN
jgi:Mrp family chromosome partitioning ATPase